MVPFAKTLIFTGCNGKSFLPWARTTVLESATFFAQFWAQDGSLTEHLLFFSINDMLLLEIAAQAWELTLFLLFRLTGCPWHLSCLRQAAYWLAISICLLVSFLAASPFTFPAVLHPKCIRLT